jgi:hypothetical protein
MSFLNQRGQTDVSRLACAQRALPRLLNVASNVKARNRWRRLRLKLNLPELERNGSFPVCDKLSLCRRFIILSHRNGEEPYLWAWAESFIAYSAERNG